MMMEAIRSSETSVLTRAIRRHITEYGSLHSHHYENLKYHMPMDILPVRYEYHLHMNN
jgi:hypothetical protein